VKPGAARSKFLALNLLLAVCAFAAPPASLPHVKQVDEHLYRGGQPGNKELKALQTVGVKAIIDLRGAGERSKREEQTVEALGMKYYSVPLRPMAAPTDKQVTLLLSLIADSNNWPVFIHCERGKDRTGTVIACYRIAHDGWPNKRALAEAVDDGLNIFERSMKNYIRHYKPPQMANESDRAGFRSPPRPRQPDALPGRP
jgi:protein tyrosine/serine phosphatase